MSTMRNTRRLRLAVVAWVLALAALVTPPAGAAPEIVVESTLVPETGTFDIGLFFLDAVDVSGVSVELQWNGTHLLSAGPPLASGLAAGSPIASVPSIFPDPMGELLVTIAASPGFTGSGEIARLSFAIPDSLIGPDTLVVSPRRARVYDAADAPVDVVLTDGLLTFNTIIVDVAAPGAPVIAMRPPYPSPFVTELRVPFFVRADGLVSLRVFDVTGRRVRDLANRRFVAGEHAAAWDGRDDAGHPAAPGVYFVRLRAAGLDVSRRVVFLPR